MEKIFTANIEWVSYEEGGRKKKPREGTRYCPLIRMNKEYNFEEWSIDFICPNFDITDVINFKFLTDKAPSYLIENGSIYGIFEGYRKVAKVKIIDINLDETKFI